MNALSRPIVVIDGAQVEELRINIPVVVGPRSAVDEAVIYRMAVEAALTKLYEAKAYPVPRVNRYGTTFVGVPRLEEVHPWQFGEDELRATLPPLFDGQEYVVYRLSAVRSVEGE